MRAVRWLSEQRPSTWVLRVLLIALFMLSRFVSGAILLAVLIAVAAEIHVRRRDRRATRWVE